MKVPPKRKGNTMETDEHGSIAETLNESPSEKEGKSPANCYRLRPFTALNESPSEKEGKSRTGTAYRQGQSPPQ